MLLCSTLIECHVDAGRKDDASQVASTASQFTRSNVPNLYKSVLGLQVYTIIIAFFYLAVNNFMHFYNLEIIKL